MNGNSLQLFDPHKKLIAKSSLSKNRSFKCSIQSAKEVCMTRTINEDHDWLWHVRYVHLNFRSLCHLGSKNLASGLPVLIEHNKSCEICHDY